MQTSFKIISQNEKHQEITDQISLTYEERFIRRKKLISDSFESYEEIDQSEAFCKVKKNFTIENANQQISDAINSLTI